MMEKTIENLVWTKDIEGIRKRLLFVSLMGICEGMIIVFFTMTLRMV